MKAMILAAGRGERMRPLTDACPKPLLEAGGKPLIVWHIERLAAAGIHEMIINHAHLGEMLERTLGDGKRWGVSIQYSAEDQALETAGGIRRALPLLGEAPFLVVNGDVYCDIDFKRFCSHVSLLHSQKMAAHIVLVDNPLHHPQGDYALERDGCVSATGAPKRTFAGIGLYQPTLFSTLSDGAVCRIPSLLAPAMEERQVSGEHYPGFWMDIGTPQRLATLNDLLRRRRARDVLCMNERNT